MEQQQFGLTQDHLMVVEAVQGMGAKRHGHPQHIPGLPHEVPALELRGTSPMLAEATDPSPRQRWP